MSLAYETVWPASRTTAEQQRAASDRAVLRVMVVFTTVNGTLAALNAAGLLADRLHASITLIVPQVVPYPLPLSSPPVLIDWSERRFRTLAGKCSVETRVALYLCRDRQQTIEAVLKPDSLIVIGSRRRWWPTADSRLAKRLRRAGHEVILAEVE